MLEEIAVSDIVVGCEFIVLIIGLLDNKRVISSIPPGGKACSLPHHGVEHLKALCSDK